MANTLNISLDTWKCPWHDLHCHLDKIRKLLPAHRGMQHMFDRVSRYLWMQTKNLEKDLKCKFKEKCKL